MERTEAFEDGVIKITDAEVQVITEEICDKSIQGHEDQITIWKARKELFK